MNGHARPSVYEYHREFIGSESASICRMIDACVDEYRHGARAGPLMWFAAARNARGEWIEMFTCVRKSPRRSAGRVQCTVRVNTARSAHYMRSLYTDSVVGSNQRWNWRSADIRSFIVWLNAGRTIKMAQFSSRERRLLLKMTVITHQVSESGVAVAELSKFFFLMRKPESETFNISFNQVDSYRCKNSWTPRKLGHVAVRLSFTFAVLTSIKANTSVYYWRCLVLSNPEKEPVRW